MRISAFTARFPIEIEKAAKFFSKKKNNACIFLQSMVCLTSSRMTRAYRGVAQFGRALRSGRRGRKFESCRLDEIR